ncbi:MAG: DMT family transporter [Candidatus Woesebacteria bacterium]|nr:DMT family transporter [Candidatus Woesebacteria bacterium]
MNPARKRAYIELLIVSVIWGVASPIIKYTLGGFSPGVFLTYRFFISAVLALIIFAVTGFKFPKNPKVLALTLFNGFLLSTVSLGLLFLGTNKTTSIDSNVISTMAPITIALAGIFFLKERVTKREAVGILIALTGTLITIIEPVLKSGGALGALEGNLLVFASVIVATITAVLAKLILRDNVDAITATNLSFVVGFVTILPFGLPQILNSNFRILTSVPLSYHLGVFYMAILSGTLAYFLWHKAEKTIEISEVSVIAYLYPLFGTPLAVFWLGEKITPPFVIGAIVIAIGVFLAEVKKKRVASLT